jgi:hypothetical protein
MLTWLNLPLAISVYVTVPLWKSCSMMKNAQEARDGSAHHAHKTSSVSVVLHTPCKSPMRTDLHFLRFLKRHMKKEKINTEPEPCTCRMYVFWNNASTNFACHYLLMVSMRYTYILAISKSTQSWNPMAYIVWPEQKKSPLRYILVKTFIIITDQFNMLKVKYGAFSLKNVFEYCCCYCYYYYYL